MDSTVSSARPSFEDLLNIYQYSEHLLQHAQSDHELKYTAWRRVSLLLPNLMETGVDDPDNQLLQWHCSRLSEVTDEKQWIESRLSNIDLLLKDGELTQSVQEQHQCPKFPENVKKRDDKLEISGKVMNESRSKTELSLPVASIFENVKKQVDSIRMPSKPVTDNTWEQSKRQITETTSAKTTTNKSRNTSEPGTLMESWGFHSAKDLLMQDTRKHSTLKEDRNNLFPTKKDINLSNRNEGGCAVSFNFAAPKRSLGGNGGYRFKPKRDGYKSPIPVEE